MLRHAFFAEFKSGPKFVIWGDGEDMTRLMEALAAASNGAPNRPLSDIPDSLSVDGSALVMETVAEDVGLWRDRRDPDLYHWQVNEESWLMFAEQVESLTRCSTKRQGHQYLDCLGDDEIAVLVSCGEYPDDMKP
ncbi:MAG TPA: hypothetical protein VMU01_04345 [Rhizomicrobium sp.]|nr:hypothetical protein [Rhizomicrobium sp.]